VLGLHPLLPAAAPRPMATGDLAGNVSRLVDHLRAIHYPAPVSARGLREGDAGTLLPILRYALQDYSKHVAAFLYERVRGRHCRRRCRQGCCWKLV
jgi:hypothetical protein